jgi:hypothetical protein
LHSSEQKDLLTWGVKSQVSKSYHEKVELVEHRAIYSILSKGIHELSEQECLKAFPIMKVGIEMILDEKIKEQEKQAKEAEAKKAIAELTGKLKDP